MLQLLSFLGRFLSGWGYQAGAEEGRGILARERGKDLLFQVTEVSQVQSLTVLIPLGPFFHGLSCNL